MRPTEARLPRLTRSDWHIHTHHSDCGHPEATPEAIVRAAQQAGLEAIGITDHIVLPRDRKRPERARRELPPDLGGLRVYIGCEANMQSPTRASIDARFAAGLDYVVMAASHLFHPGVEECRDLSPRSMAAFILRLMEGAVTSGLADIIAHPFSVPECPVAWRYIIEELDLGALSGVAAAAARAGVAVELNPRFLREEPAATRRLFDPILDGGCKVAISSDAHHPSSVGCRGPAYAAEHEVRALGVTPERLWRIEDRVSAARRSPA